MPLSVEDCFGAAAATPRRRDLARLLRGLVPHGAAAVRLAVLVAIAATGCADCNGMVSGGGGDGGAHKDGGADAGADGTACGDGGSSSICGGLCVDVQSDAAHCGTCGTACASGALCCAGTCVATASCSFAVTRVSPDSGWINGGTTLHLGGAGFAKGMKVYIGDGRAPVRVVDGQNAIVLTPPGPVGAEDVKVVSPSGATAIRAGAFSYQTGGLTTSWVQRKLSSVRGEDPGVAVMQDGRVLIAGGTKVPDDYTMALPTADVYSHDQDNVMTPTSVMSTPRWQNSAVTLLDGRVLVVGGACLDDNSKFNGDPTLADLFDPTTNMFTQAAGKLSVPRCYTRAALLPDGRVLIASANDPSVDVFDPDTGLFTQIPHSQNHVFGLMTRLRDGRVLLAGGDGGEKSSELFDGDTDQFTMTGALQQARSMGTIHTLPDGRAIAIGGADMSAGGIHLPLSTVEAYDPTTGMWSTLPYTLQVPRAWHASALLRDGTILVMGGYTVDGKCDSLDDSVDQLDPVAKSSTKFATLPNKNTEWNAVTLLDGSVLGVGGGACGTSAALPDLDFLAGGPG